MRFGGENMFYFSIFFLKNYFPLGPAFSPPPSCSESPRFIAPLLRRNKLLLGSSVVPAEQLRRRSKSKEVHGQRYVQKIQVNRVNLVIADPLNVLDQSAQGTPVGHD